MLTLFFVDDLPTIPGSRYEFSGDEAHHAIKVLRTQVGDTFNLSDGKGGWSTVTAEEITKKTIFVRVIESGFQPPLEVEFTVIQAIPKSDRVKESIELSTEGGANRIIMWKSQRSIGKGEDKIDKLQVTAREASKQSRRFYIPTIDGVATTADIVTSLAAFDLVLVFHESATSKLSSVVRPGARSVALIIGPEGGLTDSEVTAFTDAGAKVVLMGRPILRSAHAGLAALSAVNTALAVW